MGCAPNHTQVRDALKSPQPSSVAPSKTGNVVMVHGEYLWQWHAAMFARHIGLAGCTKDWRIVMPVTEHDVVRSAQA